MNKILLINDFYEGGGAEGVFRDTYNLLKRQGVKVDLFYGFEKHESPKNIITYFYNLEIKKKLEEKLNSFKPTIVHIHNYYHYLSPSIFSVIKAYKKKNNLKVVFTAHDYHLICPSSGMMIFENEVAKPIEPSNNDFIKLLFKTIDHRGWKYSFIKKMYWFWSIKILNVRSQIDSIISPSEFLKEVFVLNGINHSIHVIRNPFKGNVPLNVRDEKISCSKQIKCLFIGRLSQEKGLLEFLKAFKKLKDTDNISLDILGVGAESERLKEFVIVNKMNNVCFHGFKKGSDLENFLIKANVLLLPSIWYENAPLSIIEGAAFGNIILAKNLGGMIELSKMTKEYLLVDNWSFQIETIFKKLRQMPSNEVIDIAEFSASNYLSSIIKQYFN